MKYKMNQKIIYYKDEKLTDKENINMLKSKNFDLWKNIYEKFYDKSLEYTCDNKLLPKYVLDSIR